MSRGDQLAGLVVASVALGGCMVIYADPELPDVVVSWYEDDCRPEIRDVAMKLVAVDTASSAEMTVPCADLKFTFVDVARELYSIEGLLQDDRGEAFSRSGTEVDLRNGFDQRVDMYFGVGFANYRVAWTFDMGATCESLGADYMALRFTAIDDPGSMYQGSAACQQTPFFGAAPDGTYTLAMRAISFRGGGDTTVATSPESAEFVIADPDITNLGVITLSP